MHFIKEDFKGKLSMFYWKDNLLDIYVKLFPQRRLLDVREKHNVYCKSTGWPLSDLMARGTSQLLCKAFFSLLLWQQEAMNGLWPQTRKRRAGVITKGKEAIKFSSTSKILSFRKVILNKSRSKKRFLSWHTRTA